MKNIYWRKLFLAKIIPCLLILTNIGLKDAIGQSDTTQSSPLKKILKAEILIGSHPGIGVAYEIPIGKRSIAEFSTGIGAVFGITNEKSGAVFGRHHYAYYFQVQDKLYYNLEKRKEKEKTLLNNTGNYIGASFKWTSRRINYWDNHPEIFANHVGHISFFWGLQRPIGKAVLVDFNLGATCIFDFETKRYEVIPLLKLRFSYIFQKIRKK